jgi:L-fuconolactonase
VEQVNGERNARRELIARVSVTVDSHLHMWDAAHTPQPWMSVEHAAIARAFGPLDVVPLIQRNGIDRVIVVQGACLDSDTDYILDESDAFEWIGAVTAWVAIDDPHRAAARLDVLNSRAKFRAVRHLSHNEPDHWLVRPDVLESIAMLQERELILEIPVVFPRHFDDVVTLAERFPRLCIVIDHLGKPPIGSAKMLRWERELREAAAHTNVLAKVSGLNTALDSIDWTADDLRPSIEVALDCFGPERLMCGSDWPVALLNGDYDRVWAATAGVLAELAPDHTDALLGGNASRVYRLDSRVESGP